MMKRLVFATLALSLSGCAMVSSPVMGTIYTDIQGPLTATSVPLGMEKGEACASGILGIATGDASLTSAAKKGRIAQITHVDHTSFSILGIYSKYCTIAYGRRGKGADSSGGAAPAQ